MSYRTGVGLRRAVASGTGPLSVDARQSPHAGRRIAADDQPRVAVHLHPAADWRGRQRAPHHCTTHNIAVLVSNDVQSEKTTGPAKTFKMRILHIYKTTKIGCLVRFVIASSLHAQ